MLHNAPVGVLSQRPVQFDSDYFPAQQSEGLWDTLCTAVATELGFGRSGGRGDKA